MYGTMQIFKTNIKPQLAALAQMVACLPLVQQVRGSIPGEVVNFNLKIFNLGAMCRHRVSPSPFLSSSSSQQHNNTTQTVTLTVTPNLNFLPHTIQILIPHVMWSAQAVRDSKIDHTQRHLSTLRGT